MVPQSRGGTDHIENLQLLCSNCNRIKGDRTQEYLMARLAEIDDGGVHDGSLPQSQPLELQFRSR